MFGALFDTMHAEKSVSEGMRPFFQQLETSLIKLAMADPEFLASPAHPAHKVLNTLDRISMVAGDDGKITDARLLRLMSRWTDRINAEADKNPGVFEEARTQLERVTFRDCVLTEADLLEARLREVTLERCSLAGADVRGTRFERCLLRGCDIDGLHGIERLQEAYLARFPDYDKGITVPAIVDVPSGQVVTNDFAQLTLDLSTEWTRHHRDGAPDLYPEPDGNCESRQEQTNPGVR